MTNNIPKSKTIFSGINMDDSKAVADAIRQFCFDDIDHQSEFLTSLKDDLGISIPMLAKVLAIPQRTMERFTFGETAMKPVHIRALALFLYVRSTNTVLFNQLLTVSGSIRRRAIKI